MICPKCGHDNPDEDAANCVECNHPFKWWRSFDDISRRGIPRFPLSRWGKHARLIAWTIYTLIGLFVLLAAYMSIRTATGR
jgi:hypothetical protein